MAQPPRPNAMQRELQSIPGYYNLHHDENYNPYSGTTLPIEKLDEIRISDIDSFLQDFEICLGRKLGDKKTAETRLMTTERLWNSVYTVYADPRRESAIALGENVGSNLAIRVASTKRASLLAPLSKYFIQMGTFAKREILNASKAEVHEHQVKGPISWLYFQHMRYIYAKAAQAEVNGIAKKCALYHQNVKQNEAVQKEIAREKERVEKGESSLGQAGLYFEESTEEVPEGFFVNVVDGFKDAATLDPFVGAPGLKVPAKSVMPDKKPFVGAGDGDSTGGSRRLPSVIGSGKRIGVMIKTPFRDDNLGIGTRNQGSAENPGGHWSIFGDGKELAKALASASNLGIGARHQGSAENPGGHSSIFGDGKKFAKAPASAGNLGVGAQDPGSAGSSPGRPSTFGDGRKFAKKVDVFAMSRASNDNLGMGASASSHATTPQVSTPVAKEGGGGAQGLSGNVQQKASAVAESEEGGSPIENLASDPELLGVFAHVAQERRGSLSGRESTVTAALAGDDKEHDPARSCAQQ